MVLPDHPTEATAMDIDSTRSHLPTTINPVNLAAPVLSETAYASSSSSSNFRETETFENHNRTSATPPLATRLNHLDLVATHSDVGDPPVGNQPTSESFPASRKTGYIYDERMMLHAPLGWVNEDTPFTDRLIQVQRESEDYENFRKRHDHPEDPRRISRIYEQMRRNGLIEQMVQLPMVEMSKKQAMLVHNERIYDEAEDQSSWSIDKLRANHPAFEHHSLYINTGTFLSANLSCGGVITSCQAVLSGKVKNAFAIVRPPGHHAEPDSSMGFCIYNNVAVATKVVREEMGVKKVLILDWDVHHGNGTQRAFNDDPNVLYMSIHRHDGGTFYPCSDFGAMDSVGVGEGEGKSVNIPWPKQGFADADYIYAFQKIIMPIAYEFAPDLIIISAGFDAAEGDTLGECKVTPACYAHMTYMLQGLARGRLVVALEGGYNLQAISNSAEAVVRVLLGEELPELAPIVASDLATEVIYQVAKVQSRYWRCIDVKACAPLDEEDDPEFERVYHLLDLVKQHRAKYLYDHHQMFVMPIADPSLDAMFRDQIMTDGDLYDKETLIVFVHDFGNLRVDTANTQYTNVNLEKSRLIDSSNAMVRWVQSKGYAILDVNVMKTLPTHRAAIADYVTQKHSSPKAYQQLIKYVWDNYVELVDNAKHVVFIGYGTGCSAVMSLVNARELETKVKAVIQVAGMHTIARPDPNDDSKREWFRKNSKLFVSSDHPLLDDSRVKKRLHTQILTYPVDTLDLLKHALPDIEAFVSKQIGADDVAPSNGTNGTDHMEI